MRLQDLFQRGRPILFLGAGPSVAVNGPSWKVLARELSEEFEVPYAPMPELCNRLCRFGGKRREVEEFLDRRLRPLRPSDDIIQLLSLPWEAVFTTNYDLVPEHASQVALSSHRLLQVHDDASLGKVHDAQALHVYKIMGSCSKRWPEPGYMQVSTSDIRTAFEQRRPYLQFLRRLLIDHDLLVVGSSLEDELLFDLLEEMANEPGPEFEHRIVLAKPSPLQEPFASKALEFGIVYYAADLAKVVADLTREPIEVRTSAGRRVVSRGREVLISRATEDMQTYGGTIIDSLFPGEVPKNKNEFYRKSVYSRSAFAGKWDFLRDVAISETLRRQERGQVLQVPGLINRIHQYLRTEEVPTFLLLGPAGSAKSMTGLRMVHDWVQRGDLAVLIDGNRDWFEGQITGDVVTRLLQEIESSLKGITVPSERANLIPDVLIVLDNCVQHINQVRFLVRALKRAGHKHSTVVVTGHKGDLDVADRHYFTEIWELSPHVSDAEKRRFKEFVWATFPDISTAFAESVLQDADTRTFFGLLYNLVTASREPLEGAALQEYDRLAAWEQDLVGLVATFQAHRIPLPEQIAWRRHPKMRISEFLQSIDEGHLVQILYRIHAHPFTVLEVQNHEVARTIFHERVEKKGKRLSQIVQSIIPLIHREPDEIGFFQDNLIRIFSQERETNITKSEAERILGAAAAHLRTRALVHHHGKTLKRAGHYPEAEAAFKRAISDFRGGEREANIHHSLGELYSRWASEEAEGNPEFAKSLVTKAKDEYRIAKSDQSSYAIHGMAKLYVVEATLSSDLSARRRALLEALKACEMGRATASDFGERELFLTLRSQIIHRISEIAVTPEDARELARAHRNVLGYLYLADRRVAERDLTELGSAELVQLLDIVNEGLNFDPAEPALNHLRVRLLYVLDDRQTKTLLDITERLIGYLGESDRSLLRAKIFAAAKQYEEAQAEIGKARRYNPEGLVPFVWSDEELVRDGGAPAKFKVESQKGDSVVRLTPTLLLEAPGFDSGDWVNIAVSLRGFVATGRDKSEDTKQPSR